MTERTPITLSRFAAGDAGQWQITSIREFRGGSLPSARFLAIDSPQTGNTAWTLRGAGSNLRYTTAAERVLLQAKQEGLGRPTSTRAALLPIRKSAEWWAMAQDERRAVYERGSHLPIGLDYLPGVARKLYHSRDHGEPFDFLTWFEFAPDQETAFDHMLVRLRTCAEWEYVDREIDIRLTRVSD
ncbi:chlorite dismutase family protein [Rhizobium sp. Root149]|jgi:hypothetical protein|uniref:chlorite dismutase family protein n=1 Tax=Rhizobium sp. Root149 TaxID=1736473 RepID=UPI0009EC352F|nr:chlorite dismutase family protein [Rhizobium sp. Root149]